MACMYAKYLASLQDIVQTWKERNLQVVTGYFHLKHKPNSPPTYNYYCLDNLYMAKFAELMEKISLVVMLRKQKNWRGSNLSITILRHIQS